MLQEFFDNLYQYHYTNQKKKGVDPQVMPLVIISFTQTANIFLLLNIVFFLFNLESKGINKDHLLSGLIGSFIIISIFNFIKYQIKDRKKLILNRDKKLPKQFKIVASLYLILSLFMPIFAIYFFQEIW